VLDAGTVEHVQRCNLEVASVQVSLMAGEGTGDGLFVLEAPAHVIVGHLHKRGFVREKDWSIFGVVGHMPDTGGGFQHSLVAIGIKFRIYFTQRHRGHRVFDTGVLVECACCISGVGTELGGFKAVADGVEVVGESVSADDGIGEFRALVVAEGIGLDGRSEGGQGHQW
jgi:hypothetical protein